MEILEHKKWIESKIDGIKMAIVTGSRVFGDATEDSDFDLVLLDGGIDIEQIFDLGFKQSGSSYDGEKFWFFRKMPENINLIVTNDIIKFHIWSLCNEATIRLGLNKEQRQILFSTMIDGD